MQDRHLVINLEETSSHNLDYWSGMLESQNKFWFTDNCIADPLSIPSANNDVARYCLRV